LITQVKNEIVLKQPDKYHARQYDKNNQ